MSDYYCYLFNQKDPEYALNRLLHNDLFKSLVKEEHEQLAIAVYTVSGNEGALKSALYEQSLLHEFDYCLLPKNRSYGPFKLAVFDMDSTLIPIEVIDELAKQAGVGEEVSEITEAAMRGELDFNQSLEQRVQQLKGLSVDAIKTVKRQLEFNPGVEAFCRYFIQQSGKIAIASGGFMPFAEELARRLPFSQLRANRLIYADGALTGEVEYPIVNADVKTKSLLEWASVAGLKEQQCIAVGDGANDLKMLQQAGIGVAYKAKPTLGKSADCVLNVGYLDSLVNLLPLIEQRHRV
ncbi:MAG TPA: phosphoserine phosphatase SerB [Kangiella sp.]